MTAGPSSTTRDRLLDAALAGMARHGLAKLTLEDVAREAAMSRQTVYRYFGNRDALITAVVLREERVFLDRIAAAADRHAELRPSMEAGIRAGLLAAREHPLLDRLLDTEPEALLPFLTTGGGPVLSAARPALERLLASRLPHVSQTIIRRVADVATRLFVSYAINPPDDDVDEVVTGLVDLVLHGLKTD